MCMGILPECLCTTCMYRLWKPKEGLGFPRTGVTESCQPPRGWIPVLWESNSALNR